MQRAGLCVGHPDVTSAVHCAEQRGAEATRGRREETVTKPCGGCTFWSKELDLTLR